MISSLLTVMLAVALLGLWHIVLVRLGAEPMWARTLVRVLLAATCVVQAVGFTVVQSMSVEVRLDQVNHVLNTISSWTMWTDGVSAVLLGIVVLVMATLTVRRWVSGPGKAHESP